MSNQIKSISNVVSECITDISNTIYDFDLIIRLVQCHNEYVILGITESNSINSYVCKYLGIHLDDFVNIYKETPLNMASQY